ncbi:MAG: replication initiation protein [Kurthia sp.]|nr:replication initiation protein [Candidatus Kurthia equi]
MPRKNEKKQLINYETSIQKSNALSMAKFNQGLTLSQTQFFAFSIFKTNEKGESVFNKSEFEEKFGLTKYNTADAKRDVKKLYNLSFSTEDLEQDKYSYKRLIDGIEYDKGLFTISWTKFFAPHILELKDKYITTDISITSQFRSAFTWTLYDYLKANYGYWHKIVSKEALIRLFGIEGKKTYDNTAQFKRGVLDVAIEEINTYTEFEVKYKEIKKGRAIIGFDIYWSTGVQQAAATSKQIQELATCISSVLDNRPVYKKIKDSELRLRAYELLDEIESYKEYIDEPICITSSIADIYLKRANQIMNELDYIVEMAGRNVPTFYNWLDERESEKV